MNLNRIKFKSNAPVAVVFCLLLYASDISQLTDESSSERQGERAAKADIRLRERSHSSLALLEPKNVFGVSLLCMCESCV